MIYLGTEEAKILTHDLKYLYDNKISKQIEVAANLEAMSGYSKDELDKILKENEAELAKLMN